MDLWECGLLIKQSLIKYNDMYRYILSVIDVFSKYLHLVPVKTKRGPAITSAFPSLFHDVDSRRPVWLRTDKGKEIPSKHFQDMLHDEDIQFQDCRNTDVKCAFVEHAHRTIRDRHMKFFTSSNSYRYIDVLPKFVMYYNDTVHTTTCMAPSRVTDSDVLDICRRMEARRQRVRLATSKIRVGQHVRISKEKMRFAKAAEHNISTEIFRIVKVIHRRPRVY